MIPGRHQGVRDRPLLVLLPGMDGTGELFRPLLGVIPADVRTRVITYPPDRARSYQDLLGVAESHVHGEPDLVLVAESFSGPVALRLAAAHPQRVRAVVLCATFVRSPLPRWLRCLCRPVLFRLPLPAFAVRGLMTGRDAPESLVRSVREAVARVEPGVLAARLREVFRLDCVAALRDCAAPLLFLAPTRDALLGRKSVRLLRAVRPDVPVRSVAGPHLLFQREPLAAWREVAAFLEGFEWPGRGGGSPSSWQSR